MKKQEGENKSKGTMIRVSKNTAKLLKFIRKTAGESYNDIIRRNIEDEVKTKKHFQKKDVKDKFVDSNNARNSALDSLDDDDTSDAS